MEVLNDFQAKESSIRNEQQMESGPVAICDFQKPEYANRYLDSYQNGKKRKLTRSKQYCN